MSCPCGVCCKSMVCYQPSSNYCSPVPQICCPPSCPPSYPCPPQPCNVSIPYGKSNPYSICYPLYPCDGCCVPVKPCGMYCQPFPTPGSKNAPKCDNELTRNKQYPQVCVPFCPPKKCCWIKTCWIKVKNFFVCSLFVPFSQFLSNFYESNFSSYW